MTEEEPEITCVTLDTGKFTWATKEAFAHHYGVTPSQMTENLRRFEENCAWLDKQTELLRQGQSEALEGIHHESFVAAYDKKIVGIDPDLEMLCNKLRENGDPVGQVQIIWLSQDYKSDPLPTAPETIISAS